MEDRSVTPAAAVEAEAAWEVLARFRSPEAMDRAIDKLKSSGFDHGSLGLPEVDPPASRNTLEAGSQEIATDTGAQQRRVLSVSVLGAIAAMIGALIAATKGASVAAIAGAAIGAGIVVAIVVELIGRAIRRTALRRRADTAAQGKLVLAVRTDSAERRERARAVLRETGGELL